MLFVIDSLLLKFALVSDEWINVMTIFKRTLKALGKLKIFMSDCYFRQMLKEMC